jgi:hypothetical protein
MLPARLPAETLDDGKDLGCASLREAFGRADMVVSEVIRLFPSFDRHCLFVQRFAASPTIEREY